MQILQGELTQFRLSIRIPSQSHILHIEGRTNMHIAQQPSFSWKMVLIFVLSCIWYSFRFW